LNGKEIATQVSGKKADPEISRSEASQGRGSVANLLQRTEFERFCSGGDS